MEQSRSESVGFFDVLMEKQTYLSLIYLLITFPLGIFYFVYMAVGISLGIGLIPIFIGIPMLYVFLISIKYLMRFERKMAGLFLGINIDESIDRREKGIGILVRFKDEAFNTDMWKSLIYINLKFFFGILIFTLCVTLISISLGFISAPVVYQIIEYYQSIDGGLHLNIGGTQFYTLLSFFGISATPMQEALILMFLGVFILIGSLHIFNKTAYFMGHLLKAMSPSRN